MTNSNGAAQVAPTYHDWQAALANVAGDERRNQLELADLCVMGLDTFKQPYSSICEIVRKPQTTIERYVSVARSVPIDERPADPEYYLTFNHLARIAPVAKHNKALALDLIKEYNHAQYFYDGFYHDNPDDPNSIIEATAAFNHKVDMAKVDLGIKEPPKVTEASQFWDVPKAVIERIIAELQSECTTAKIKNETLAAMPEDGAGYIKIILAVAND